MPLINVKNLSFNYAQGGRESAILKDVSFTVEAGEFLAVQGPSGSGKSTLFYVLGALLRPSKGQVEFAGANLTTMSDLDLARFRNRQIGFIFQQFHLLPRATVLENILLPTQYPAELQPVPGAGKERAIALANRFGLGEHLSQLPNQLSGGQQQRVAIARALMHDTKLILADEPTGNLDSKNAELVMATLEELHAEGRTIILITHDPEVARRAERVLTVRDGLVTTGPRIAKTFAKGPETVKAEVIPKSVNPSYAHMLIKIFPLAVNNLWRNKAKSLLTMLGVIIGVAAVLAMITTGEFTKKKILEGYESLGVNKIQLRGYQNWGRRSTAKKRTQKTIANNANQLEFTSFDYTNDLERLRTIFPEVQSLSPALNIWSMSVTYGGRTWGDEARGVGVNQDYAAILNHTIEEGRGLSPFHIENRNSVCVLGAEVAQNVNLTDPVGKIVTIGIGENMTFPCKVIGVLKPQTSNQSWYQPNKLVLMPFTYLKTMQNYWDSQIRDVSIKLRDGSDVEKSGKKIRGFFEQKYGDSGRFSVDSDSTLVAQMKRFLSIFSLLLGAIAFLSLVVGGIGIHNMMLVSVADRIKEIGLRKALGATSKSIRSQILTEAIVLCSSAGIIGMAVGFGACGLMMYGATKFMPTLQFQWIINVWAIAISCISIVVVGVVSGLTPAVKAEKLEVIEALRSE